MPIIKLPNSFVIRLVIVMMILILFCGFLLFLERPNYIELNIPSPMSYLPNGDWDETNYMTKIYPGDYNRQYILRKVGSAYGQNGAYTFDTEKSVIGYFDDYLRRAGWERASIIPFYKCLGILPEKKYIKAIARIEEYVKSGSDPFNTYEKVCVVVIPETVLEKTEYQVILISERDSPITILLSGPLVK